MAGPIGRGNNLDTVRRHNLATVLALVHHDGPASRSELTRATGLNRSTIGALVAELAAYGLVVEHSSDAGRRVGRPSPVVGASGSVVAIAVNPEIDAVTVGVVGLDGTVLQRVRRGTDGIPSVEDAVLMATAAIGELSPVLASARLVVGIGAAVPGMVRDADGVVRLAPHLGWADAPFAALLREAIGLPVLAANDASLGARAERLFGAGRGVGDLVYLNGGAGGIGGGVITGGTAMAGAAGYAGELGHTLVNSSGVRCHCGAIGCLETEVAQSALLELLGLASADPDELDRALAASADPAVHAEVERQLGFLAVAIKNAVNVFNPRLVVLGGFLSSLFAADPSLLERLVREESLPVPAEEVRIVRAELGSRLLMIGAAELAFGPLLGDPAAAAG